jgi:glucuronoarabinoxylan endo-1,4-beta-xylanase
MRRWGAAMAAVAVLVGCLVAAGQGTAFAASAVTIDGGRTRQRIDGFGISEAFGQANAIRNVSDSALRTRMLDLLFSPAAGAGFSILRNLIPSDPNHTMVPNPPANPSTPTTYVWDGNNDATDWGQLWLTKQAVRYGVSTIYNDAWSAPGYMKTNNNEANGGMLCGVPGASCGSGDWRQAYANYLVHNVRNYASAGIKVPYLGFANEPTFTAGYSSMLVNPAQAADFAKILAATVRSAGLSTKVTCCDALGWNSLPGYTSAVLGDSAAASAVGLFTSHGYSAGPNSVINTGGKPVWQSEWSNGQGTFNVAWDDNSAESGFRWAQNIHTGLTAANLNAFLYWWGISNSTSSNGALIQLNGTTLNPSKRYAAFVNYSKFIRPGAVRVDATSPDTNLKVSAFKNIDGSVAIVVLNAAATATQTSFTLPRTGITAGSATPYLTNGSNDTARQRPITVTASGFSASVPARSLVTYTIPAT